MTFFRPFKTMIRIKARICKFNLYNLAFPCSYFRNVLSITFEGSKLPFMLSKRTTAMDFTALKTYGFILIPYQHREPALGTDHVPLLGGPN